MSYYDQTIQNQLMIQSARVVCSVIRFIFARMIESVPENGVVLSCSIGNDA
jgi:hypothetical protein